MEVEKGCNKTNSTDVNDWNKGVLYCDSGSFYQGTRTSSNFVSFNINLNKAVSNRKQKMN